MCTALSCPPPLAPGHLQVHAARREGVRGEGQPQPRAGYAFIPIQAMGQRLSCPLLRVLAFYVLGFFFFKTTKYDKWLFREAKHKGSPEQWFLNVNVLANHRGIWEEQGEMPFVGSQLRTLRAPLQQEGWKLDSSTLSPSDHRVGYVVEWRVADGSGREGGLWKNNFPRGVFKGEEETNIYWTAAIRVLYSFHQGGSVTQQCTYRVWSQTAWEQILAPSPTDGTLGK